MKNRYIALSLVVFVLSGCSWWHTIRHEQAKPAPAANDVRPIQDVRPTRPTVKGLIEDVRAHSALEQYGLFTQAIQASPQLSAQLQLLIDEGLLSRIVIGQESPQGWGAWRDGSTWVFMPAFVANLSPHRIYDVVTDSDILPNNMAFVLGYMAYHAQHEKELEKGLAGISSLPTMSNEDKQDRSIELHVRVDAGAFIQGWNNVVNVATTQNQGIPLTERQSAALLLNFIFREPFLIESIVREYESLPPSQKRIAVPAAQSLASFGPSLQYHLDMGAGGIPMNERNIDAMTRALEHSELTPVKP